MSTTSPANPLDDRPALARLWTLAWPVLAQQFLVYVVMLSDSLLAGRFKPPEGEHVASQAAQTTATYLDWMISSLTVFVSVGATALVARHVGAGERPQAIQVAQQSLLLAILIGLAASAGGLLILRPGLALLGLQGDEATFAADYLRPLFLLLVFRFIEVAGVSCLIGAGDTRTGLWVLGGVAVINVPLAWGFHQGWGPLPTLGFAGIATGTAISHVIGALWVLLVLRHGRAGLKLRVAGLRPEPGLLRRLLRVGVPAGLDALSVALGQLWFLSIVNGLSRPEKAAHGIALRWEALSYLAGSAFGTAAMTLVGQNLGARRPDRAARDTWTAFGVACAVMCLCGAVFYVLAPRMFALFCPQEHQREVIAAGVPALRLIAFAMPPLACTILFTAALRGAGDTRIPLLFTWVGFFVVRIPLAYGLTAERLDLGPLGTISGANLGLMGAWIAMSADVLVRGLFFLARFAGGRWQRIEV